MEYALFLGCTIPARARNYELSTRKVAAQLGISFIDVEEFICCGFPIKSSEMISSNLLSAYNLALAQKRNLNVCTLCSSCTSALTEVEYHLAKEEEMKNEINKELSSKTKIQYNGRIKIRHFARVLHEEIGADEIKSHFRKNLSDLRIAIHYGCHYLKPSIIYDNFDSVEDPKTLDELVSITGAKVVDYMGNTRCCGGPILPVDEKIALSVAKAKLDDIANAGGRCYLPCLPFLFSYVR